MAAKSAELSGGYNTRKYKNINASKFRQFDVWLEKERAEVLEVLRPVAFCGGG